MNTAPVNLILKWYLGFEMNTVATSEPSLRVISYCHSIHLYQNPDKYRIVLAHISHTKPQKISLFFTLLQCPKSFFMQAHYLRFITVLLKIPKYH